MMQSKQSGNTCFYSGLNKKFIFLILYSKICTYNYTIYIILILGNSYCCFGPLFGPFLPPVSCLSLVLLLNNGCTSEIIKIVHNIIY